MAIKETSIKKNFSYQMIYEVVAISLPLLTSPYTSRVLGAENLGIYSYTYSIAFYFQLFAMLGIKNYGNRAIAQVRDDSVKLCETFSSIVTLHVLNSLIMAGLYAVFIAMTAKNKIYFIIQGLVVLSALLDISWFYFGIEQFKMIVTRSTVFKILNTILIFVFVKERGDLWKYCLILALGTMISQVILWIPLRKYVTYQKTSVRQMVPHIKPMLILFVPSIAVSLYKYMDKIMLGSFCNTEQLGFYDGAEKVINIPMTIITAFGTVMLPKMSNLVARGNASAAYKYIGKSIRYVMCLSFAMTAGLAGVGMTFAPFFFGVEFIPTGRIIMGLALTIPFISFANIIRTQYLIPNEKDKEYVSSIVAGAVINFIINFILISKLAAIGVMIGTIVAEVAVCLIQVWFVRKELPILQYMKNVAPFALYSTLMFVIVYKLKDLSGNYFVTLVIQVLIGTIIYGISCLIHFIITKDEMISYFVNKLKRM